MDQVTLNPNIANDNSRSVNFLYTLPNEVICMIIDYVGQSLCESLSEDHKVPNCSAPLLNLALTSRRIYALTLPALYYHFHQPDPEDLVLFFCQIIRYPHIAGYVRIFEGFSGQWLARKYLCSNPDSEWEDVQVLDEDDEDQVFDNRLDTSHVSGMDWRYIRTSVMTATNSSWRTEQWVRAIVAGSWDALMALLLLHLPNLREVVFEFWCRPKKQFPYITRLLDQASKLQNSAQSTAETSPWALSKLKSVSLEHMGVAHLEILGVWSESDVKQLMPFVKLKSVEKFYAGDVAAESIERIKEFGKLRLETKILDLHRTVLELRTLTQFLQMFTSLESLNITDWWNEPGTPYFWVSKILGHLKGSLKELHMSKQFTPGDDDLSLTRYDDSLVGSLVGFQKLESLKVPALMIQGSIDCFSSGTNERPRLVNLIPRSLKHLTLVDCDETHGRIVEEVFELIYQKAEKAPVLMNLDVGIEDVKCSAPGGSTVLHPGFSFEETGKLRDCCIKAGVVLIVAERKCSAVEAILDETCECEDCH